jgi:signal transduction histidine kinase
VEELLLLASVRQIEDVELEPLDTSSIVAEVQRRLSGLVEDYAAEIIVPTGWPQALGRSLWVEEIWINYVSNAIKYGGTPPRIELGATEREDGTVRFWVRDNGPGLTTEEQASLFLPFTTLHQMRAEGQGLGLSIVQRIVTKLGGQAGIESEGVPGKGCLFYFDLPGLPPSVDTSGAD